MMNAVRKHGDAHSRPLTTAAPARATPVDAVDGSDHRPATSSVDCVAASSRQHGVGSVDAVDRSSWRHAAGSVDAVDTSTVHGTKPSDGGHRSSVDEGVDQFDASSRGVDGSRTTRRARLTRIRGERAIARSPQGPYLDSPSASDLKVATAWVEKLGIRLGAPALLDLLDVMAAHDLKLARVSLSVPNGVDALTAGRDVLLRSMCEGVDGLLVALDTSPRGRPHW
jgi:hypothetical protein